MAPSFLRRCKKCREEYHPIEQSAECPHEKIEPKPDGGLLLTFDEWLCEEPDNIPFDALDDLTQIRLKAQYEYDREYRLTKQLSKAQAHYDKRAREIFEEIADDDKLLEEGRKAIEDTLVEWRDNRLSEFARGNGLVIREKNGRDSSIIRFGPETALRIGLKAIGQALKSKYLEALKGKGEG
jgi:hypothetical protein